MSEYPTIASMEPLLPKRESLREKATLLSIAASRLSGPLHPETQRSLARLVRSMNSYYSNLIEGNVTTPLELESAQHGSFSPVLKIRALQLEALNHVLAQDAFEQELRTGRLADICSPDFLLRMHRMLYAGLPEEHLKIRTAGNSEYILLPGELRNDDVFVGSHIPPESAVLPQFLARFRDVYLPSNFGPIDKILAAAAAHHRLLWIHPFLDGNGRVARLFSELYFMLAEIDSNGLWALSRGLARNRTGYYNALASADRSRDNDYDGRGALSQRGLDDFVLFILETAIDQVEFMTGLLDIDGLIARIEKYLRLLAIEGVVDDSAFLLVRDIYFRGQVPRSDVPRVLNKPERTARRVTSALKKQGLINSESPLGPLRLNFPANSVPIIFPALYPSVT